LEKGQRVFQGWKGLGKGTKAFQLLGLDKSWKF
jgi:hypothetical protein